jgi:NADH-quinone oxidoreductase subunit F
MDPQSLAAKGVSLGSGAIAVFNDTEDMRAFAEGVLEFLAEESCGRCMECPIAISLTQRSLAHTHYGEATPEEIEAIAYRHEFLPVILRCGLGKASHTTAYAAIQKFPDDFGRDLTQTERSWSRQ